MANILVIDDEPKMTSLICGHLEEAGHRVTTTTSARDGLDLIEKHFFDIIVTDLSMPDISGMEILEKAKEKENSEVIMMTAFGSVKTAVEAMKKGAVDYLLKPFSLEELEILINKIIKNQKTSSLGEHYKNEAEKDKKVRFIGESQATKDVKALITKVASTDATVLLTGRSGVGKEIAARELHDLSDRKNKPFIAVNCAALTETLLESELFGHEKGSFTGAYAQKRGRFELAEGGTIFLDEIAETSLSMQSKLLRVLEERNLVRVGGVDLIDIDVRVIAATNKNLKDQIETGKFREDLYFRLNVFPINIPNLSERRDDIVKLAEYFLEQLNYQYTKLSPELSKLLTDYDWPGNIRELKNVIERAMILAGGEPLSVEDFSLEIDNDPLVKTDKSAPEGLETAEKEIILNALKKTNGNKTDAAKLLKITRRRLYSRMKIHDIKI